MRPYEEKEKIEKKGVGPQPTYPGTFVRFLQTPGIILRAYNFNPPPWPTGAKNISIIFNNKSQPSEKEDGPLCTCEDPPVKQ